MADICGDNRFEVIERAKQDLLEGTNIDTSPGEMAVLDSFLFRCWQMGWLDRYDDTADAIMPMTLENAINFLDEIGWRAEHDRIMSTPQWIPCEERLPEESGLYLVTTTDGDVYEAFIDSILHLFSRFESDGFYILDNVDAWMPLPEPYGGERSE